MSNPYKQQIESDEDVREPDSQKSAEALLQEELESHSQWRLIWRQFRKHKLGVIGGLVIIFLTLLAIFADFVSPYNFAQEHRNLGDCPPTKLHFRDASGAFTLPFVYGTIQARDEFGFKICQEDQSEVYPVQLFVKGDPYKLWGLFESDLHLFGTGQDARSKGQIFVFGSDLNGRDLFSRILSGGKVSLSIGPAVLVFSLFIGIFLGGLSGFYGAWVDMIIQRFIEILQSFPALPLFLALSAILPDNLPNSAQFLGIILIFSLLGWTVQARVLRGQFLALRENEFTLAAKAMGSSDLRVIFRHLLPNAMSYVIVSATLAIPGLIIAEATLSFLGLGIKDPMTSWGLLLNDAQQWSVLEYKPWLIIPGFFILVSVLAFNFLGDALRDAVDPHTIKN